MTEPAPEIEDLERTAAWRLRLVDADPTDTASENAARRLEALADDLRQNDYTALWTELRAVGNWLGESDGISDYAERTLRASRRRRRLPACFTGNRPKPVVTSRGTVRAEPKILFCLVA